MRLKRTAAVVLASVAVLPIALFVGVLSVVIAGFDGTVNVEEEAFAGGGDCAIVFGAAAHGNEAGPGIRRRVDTAVRLYEEGKIETIIMSGGKGSAEQLSEAEIMRNYAVEQGVPSSVIIEEGASSSTWENLLFSRPLTGSCETVTGISDAYHLARIRYLALMQDWRLLTIPSDQQPNSLFLVQSIAREVGGIFYYVFKGFQG